MAASAILGRILGCVAVALALSAQGCQREQPIDGVAGYSLVRTTLAEAPGVCTPDGELTWCHSNPGIAMGQQRATVDLYFRGHDADAPLVEILLAINRCRPAEIEGILSEQLGRPRDREAARLRWDGPYAVIFAQLETERGGCQINMVSPEDEERIAALSGDEARSGAGVGEQP